MPPWNTTSQAVIMKGAVIMGLIVALIIFSIALVMIGIIIKSMLWLMVVGLVLLVVSILFAAVRGPDSA
jgi:hypothetical protein